MLPSIGSLRTTLRHVIADRTEQGHVTDGLTDELDLLADSYDDLAAFASRLPDLPLRADWPYVEPDDLESIEAECDPDGSVDLARAVDVEERIRTAFLGRVAGCMLGKPFEIGATYEVIRFALEATDAWPLDDYPTEATVKALPTLQGQWKELVRERIAHVVPDDDVNYTVLAMLALERHGMALTHDDLRLLWLRNLPVAATFGPERTMLTAWALETLGEEVPVVLNPGDELCGALIRADAYGYACPGNPALASTFAFRDASMTHRRTGVYGAMFVAAAIASAFVVDEPLDSIRSALGFVPQRSRFAEGVRSSLNDVGRAGDWLDGFERVRMRHGEFGFCRIHQEIGCLINTLRFATDVGDGICKQVMQGNDTDSFGATVGSILGAHFGSVDNRWVAPFNDDVHTALASFHERSLARIADRMAALPERIA